MMRPKLALAILAVCLLPCFIRAAPQTLKPLPGAKPRNVVFILVDDHRFDAMSCMGHPFLETPRLDALARNGVHKKNAFVTTSLCSRSQASILTGRDTGGLNMPLLRDIGRPMNLRRPEGSPQATFPPELFWKK